VPDLELLESLEVVELVELESATTGGASAGAAGSSGLAEANGARLSQTARFRTRTRKSGAADEERQGEESSRSHRSVLERLNAPSGRHDTAAS
jgi:hypothetical protein